MKLLILPYTSEGGNIIREGTRHLSRCLKQRKQVNAQVANFLDQTGVFYDERHGAQVKREGTSQDGTTNPDRYQTILLRWMLQFI
jgi:hypothetical protein